ncbi:hypothetical protein UFOVP255_46 [uncultured Caudovirales phage]|uniref:Glycine-rich domain-containing protein n=1 Tax=uncultured Caudovirales phage TaxID=2100421 RepID=A0A6J5LF46_9CAUD|nr:hypothetical protein UFOVP255_46 [uncultured Caudovirales phage]
MTIINSANYTVTQYNVLSVSSTGAVTNLAPSTSGFALASNGAAVAPSFQLVPVGLGINVKVFTYTGSSQTYTPSTGLVYADIICVGGGGGGGGCTGAGASKGIAAAGGGGGFYSRLIASAATLGSSQTVTVGAGGGGGAAGGQHNGTVGGASSVGTLCIALGGVLGSTTLVAGTNPAISNYCQGVFTQSTSGNTGDVIILGSCGGGGSSLWISNTVQFAQGGRGGSSYFGGAMGSAFGNADGTAGPGNNGVGIGTGGGGAWSCSNSTGISTQTGGNGASGIVIITEYVT